MTLGNISAGQRSRTAHEYVRAAVRSAILDGELAGGTRLVQSELATQLDVSTTPVREALRDLVTEGLVFFDAHRGAVVRTLRVEEVREIYELRMTLEPLMVRRVLDRITDESIEQAQQLWEQLDRETDASLWVELNRRFHAILAEPDAGSRLAQILGGLRDSASAYVGLSLKQTPKQMQVANDQHGRMVELFRRRDEDALVALTVQHLESTLAAIEQERDQA